MTETAGHGGDPPDATPLDHPGSRPPRSDPAAMRETLDAARRRLGPADPTGRPPESAARQRALLREAVASRSVPLLTGPTTATPPTASAVEAAGDDPDADAPG